MALFSRPTTIYQEAVKEVGGTSTAPGVSERQEIRSPDKGEIKKSDDVLLSLTFSQIVTHLGRIEMHSGTRPSIAWILTPAC